MMEQQNLALKDLEIMRLREALWVAHEHAKLNSTYHKNQNVYDICEQALSTPTTYDDLMAWHNEQLGEPVAWRYKTNKVHTWITEDEPPEDAYDEGTLKPLYAKKG